MGVLSSVKSLFGGSPKVEEAFGEGQRYPLTSDMVKALRRHFQALNRADLSTYTFERRRSQYQDSRSDLVIYDGNDQPVLYGREQKGGAYSFWTR